MIDFIKKLFIPKYKPMGQSRPCLAETTTQMKRLVMIWVPKMKMIFALAASRGGQNIQNKFLSTKFSQHLSNMAVML
jgi:hypothetical protein